MHASYLRKIRQDPRNDRPRLDYARWLGDTGQPAASTWVHTEVALSARPNDVSAREAFHRARASVPPVIRLSLEQPGVLRTSGLPLPSEWIGIGLGNARPARGTLHRYDYGSLPPIPEHVASGWTWIEKGPASTLVNGSLSRHIRAVGISVANAGYALPPDFVQLFDRFVGQRRVIRSCTGARFLLDPAAWQPAEVHGGLLVPFYLDGETSLGWGLWLHPSGSEAVLGFPLTASIGASAPPPRISRTHQVTELYWVSPSLTSFVYRTALENQIWFAQHGRADETQLEAQAYLDHYR